MTGPLPERITLRSNPLEAVLLLIAAAALAFLFVSRIPPDQATTRVVTTAIIFLIAMLVAVASLRQLTLDATGFSEGNLFGRTRHAWRDCSPFGVSAGSGRVQINSIRAATSAGEFRLRTRYGRSLDEVAALMNRFRVRALAMAPENRA
ncbi:MAG TPA: hypothetical protein PK080_10870 [Hyphomonadaceae bacterium]|nr:hypothetical protein [Hyphomonadaceae bacterium]